MCGKLLLLVSVLLLLGTIFYWWFGWSGGPPASLKLIYTFLSVAALLIFGIVPAYIKPDPVKPVPERTTS